MDNLRFREDAIARVEKGHPHDALPIKGKWVVQHFRKGSLIDPSLSDEYVMIDEFEAFNAPTNAGVNHVLDAAFGGGSQISPWYIGLIDNAAGALANTDTLASKAWTEAVGYSGGARIEWQDDAASSRTKANSTTADFNMTGSATIRGLFVCEDDTPGGTTGVLWSTALFGTPSSVVNTDVLKLVYSLSA
jgi:hypothetical protein